jgi:hypothetical protein
MQLGFRPSGAAGGNEARKIFVVLQEADGKQGKTTMERRDFLGFAFGAAFGTVMLAAGAQAAPVSPQPVAGASHLSQPGAADVRPAIATAEEVAKLQPEQVRWRRRHRHVRHRHGGMVRYGHVQFRRYLGDPRWGRRNWLLYSGW